ncbi:MAG: light-harvesting protein [Rhodobacterales bacterium]|jgi:light-harvesting protein B-800-850 alpha chain|nr:light-harvesting protein [Rhodobacterales bacterium]
MNNAKMWLVVKPTVGIPLFLSAVAVGSFAVHVAVLSNTTWVADFLSGQVLGSGVHTAMLLDEAVTGPQNAAYAVPSPDGQSVLMIMPDGTWTRATLGSGATDVAYTAQTPLVLEQ